MARMFKIFCRECNNPAVIQRTDRLHHDYYELYCVCKNPECGHSWKATYNYSYSLRATKLDRDDLVDYLLKKLPREELEKLTSKINEKYLSEKSE